MMIIDITDVGSLVSDIGSLIVTLFVLLFVLSMAVRIVPEYRRLVLFRLGRLVGSRGPGIVFIVPIIDRAVTVDLRILTLDVPVQEVITKDNVPIKVNAVVYFRVLEPSRSVVEVENPIVATSQLAQTTLRSVVGSVELDEVLSSREKINQAYMVFVALDENDQPTPVPYFRPETTEEIIEYSAAEQRRQIQLNR